MARKLTVERLERERAEFERVLKLIPQSKWYYRQRLRQAIAARDAALRQRRATRQS